MISEVSKELCLNLGWLKDKMSNLLKILEELEYYLIINKAEVIQGGIKDPIRDYLLTHKQVTMLINI